MDPKIRADNYRVERLAYGAPFCWIVVDAAGEPALWRSNPKVGQVPLAFRSEALAQAAANRLNQRVDHL